MKIVVWFWFVLGAVSVAGKVFFTKPGQNAILDCGFNSNPQTLAWRRESDLIVGFVRSGMPRKGSNPLTSRSSLKSVTLHISNVKEEDAGKFSCEADGKEYQHILAVVSVSANPTGELELDRKVTLQCQVRGLTSGSTVKWKRPDETIYMESETAEINAVALSDEGAWKCVITHNEQTFSDTLKIKVKELPKTTAPPPTQSSKDRRKPSCPDCGPNRQPGVSQLDWWVWVAVGVGGLVVVLLTVFVIVMCKRIRRRKKRNQKMKNGRWLVEPKQYCQCNCPTAAARPQQGRRKEKPTALPMQPLLME